MINQLVQDVVEACKDAGVDVRFERNVDFKYDQQFAPVYKVYKNDELTDLTLDTAPFVGLTNPVLENAVRELYIKVLTTQ